MKNTLLKHGTRWAIGLLAVTIFAPVALAGHARPDRGPGRAIRLLADLGGNVSCRPTPRRYGYGYNFGHRRRYTHKPQCKRWVGGHSEYRTERICVAPGRYQRRYVPAVVETRYDPCGRPYTVVVEPAGYKKVWVPARYVTRRAKVWVPGRWVLT